MDTNDSTAARPLEPVSAQPLPRVVGAAPAWSEDEWRANAAWAVLTSVTLVGVLMLLRFLPSVAWPLVLATAGSYLFDPLVSWIVRKGMGRAGATALVLATLLGVGLLALVAIVPALVTQATRVPGYIEAALEALAPTFHSVTGRELPASWKELTGLAEGHLQEILANVLPSAGNVLGMLLGGSLSVLSFVLAALVVPVVGFYLLRGWPDLLAAGDDLVPPRLRPTVRARMSEIDRKLAGFVRGQLTMATVLATLYSTALSLIGLKLAVVVGLVTGFGNLVPYVGTGTGLALASAFCVVDFGLDWHVGAVVATYVTLVAADGVFITPRIVGDKVGLSPAAVIVAVLASGSLFGFAGVLLAVPFAAVLKGVVGVGVEAWRQTRFYRGG